LPVLRLEHVALNVADPRAMADWYVAHLGMRVVRQVKGPALSDDRLPDGSRLLMLRDPWGLALQLCARATPLVERQL